VPGVRDIVAEPFLVSLVSGIGSSLALTLFMSLLPTVLHSIFDAFFALKSSTSAQHHIQNWYFAFLIVFVALMLS
jgi:hypothetical protein